LAHVPSKLRKKIEWLFRRAEGALLPEAIRADLDPDGARLALRAASDEVEIAGASARLDHLLLAERDEHALGTYLEQYGVAGTRRFHAATETRIYQLSVETFPRHVNNVYVVLEAGQALLLDAGSGMPSSKRDLALGFATMRAMGNEEVRWEDLDLCVVSHAHSDHCGGVNELKRTSAAKLAVHELDARVISAFEERIVLATKDIDVYWKRAGLSPKEREDLRELYSFAKRLFRSERVDRTLRDGELVGAGYRVHHVPGHCPGLVCLQVHDVLLTSDHVLARITPHQFPQAITPFAGLEHYFRSLAKIRDKEGIRLALGGHEEPIWDLRARIDEIAAFHRDRLKRVLDICETPQTVNEIAKTMFGAQEGYGVILAIDEAGAHVEYLHALGRLRVDNLDEVADEPVIRYVRRSDAA
jgi:glyoxylase-like metal-dependent hydrolase (beta-lactamase superfamily II)